MNDPDMSGIADAILFGTRAKYGASQEEPLHINQAQWDKFVRAFGLDWVEKNCRLTKPIEHRTERAQ